MKQEVREIIFGKEFVDTASLNGIKSKKKINIENKIKKVQLEIEQLESKLKGKNKLIDELNHELYKICDGESNYYESIVTRYKSKKDPTIIGKQKFCMVQKKFDIVDDDSGVVIELLRSWCVKWTDLFESEK